MLHPIQHSQLGKEANGNEASSGVLTHLAPYYYITIILNTDINSQIRQGTAAYPTPHSTFFANIPLIFSYSKVYIRFF